MISYEQFCRLKNYYELGHLSMRQICRQVHLHHTTVSRWLARAHYIQRKPSARPSKLDAYKPQIIRWLETHPYSATQIFMRLRDELAYTGGYTILKDYIHKVRPPKREAFLTLSFAPGECAQVDWGEFGSVAVGNSQRRLSFFCMVLCYSRLLYVEFTLCQTMEHFLACHQNAFLFFGGLPAKIMVDNLKSAVLRRVVGEDPVLNPRYKDFAEHYGFRIKPCGVGQPHEKGRVENAVGYVKKNFLAGLDIADFSLLNPAARQWLAHIANARCHGTTKTPPAELFLKEKPALQKLPLNPYDVGVVQPVRANSQFRVTLDTNTYSVPAEYARSQLTLKVYPDQLCIYAQDKLIARHARCYQRHQDLENPDHPRALLQQRRKASDQKLLLRLLAITPKAEVFYQELSARRLNTLQHVRKIVALSEIYGTEKTARALEDALEFQAFSCEYVANLLEQRARLLPEPGALHLTRRADLLELEQPEPDLGLYGSEPGLAQAQGEGDEPAQGPSQSQ
ncbi:MAG: IS21 family transposase [Actinomycetota bacterium]